MLNEISKKLTRDNLVEVYYDIRRKAKNKHLVDTAYHLLQHDFWTLTNYGTLLVWDEKKNGYNGATPYHCNCSEVSLVKPWCRHRVARFIVMRAVNNVKTPEGVRTNPIW